jgi:hypothetical protein
VRAKRWSSSSTASSANAASPRVAGHRPRKDKTAAAGFRGVAGGARHRILGTFRDLDDPDQFVWLRGFDDMASRAPALQAFYTGPVWKENSAAANATMVDIDNVLLLRLTGDSAPFDHDPARRPPVGAPEREGTLTATISPAGTDVDGDPLVRLVTEHGKNDFPALPVREDVEVAVSLWATEPPGDLPAGTETLRLRPTPRSLLP